MNTNDILADRNALRHRRRRSKMIMLTVIASATLAFLLIAIWMRGLERQSSAEIARDAKLPEYGAITSSARFTERSGRMMTIADLKGNIWVANFMFTRCPGVCPMMSAKMADLQKSIHKATNVKLVSFTVDPEYDTPERLTAYADGYGADKDQWLFLRTGRRQIKELSQKRFMLPLANDATDPDDVAHSERFLLVDDKGIYRGYYNSNEREAMQKLLTDLGILMKQQVAAR